MNLEFTDPQLDYIVKVLAQRPYVEVAPLLAEIQRQVSAQQPLVLPDKPLNGTAHGQSPS
jgi:hypothetical protein